jgi:Domain of unknown function (DUF1707)
MTAELSWPPSSRDAAPPLRASHADRDLAVDILRVAAGEGRLTVAELGERLEAALTARTIGELATLTADLPAGTTFQAAMSQDNRASSDQLAAGRWEFLRSLLSEPRRHEPLAG